MNAQERNIIQREFAREQSDTFVQFAGQWAVALDEGLTGAAEVYAEAVRARLAGGYTTGAFVGANRPWASGSARREVWTSVRVKQPRTERDARVVRVFSNDPRARWWEFGHHNPFTRRWERVEHWRHAIDDAGDEMARAFHDLFDIVLNGSKREPRLRTAA